MYGCGEGLGAKSLTSRVFPRVLSNMNDMFSFKDCNFKVTSYRGWGGAAAMVMVVVAVVVVVVLVIRVACCGC